VLFTYDALRGVNQLSSLFEVSLKDNHDKNYQNGTFRGRNTYGHIDCISDFQKMLTSFNDDEKQKNYAEFERVMDIVLGAPDNLVLGIYGSIDGDLLRDRARNYINSVEMGRLCNELKKDENSFLKESGYLPNE
jgi:hypothetical protein